MKGLLARCEGSYGASHLCGVLYSLGEPQRGSAYVTSRSKARATKAGSLCSDSLQLGNDQRL